MSASTQLLDYNKMVVIQWPIVHFFILFQRSGNLKNDGNKIYIYLLHKVRKKCANVQTVRSAYMTSDLIMNGVNVKMTDAVFI